MAITWAKLLILIGILSFVPTLVQAKDKPNVDLKLKVEKEMTVTNAEGKSRMEWQEVKSFGPGDVLRYTITYSNTGSAEVRDAVIIDPIPAGTAYLPGSVEGANAEITFSLDGKTFQSPPLLKYKVKATGTSEQEFSASPEMYTHIRWKIVKPVAKGGHGTVRFKVTAK
jgi:uncharacterized repeat protein (TIGR01451 family)